MKKNIKFWVIGIIGILIIGVIGFGAHKGKTKVGSPSETSGKNTSTDKKLIPIKTATRKDCTLAPLIVADKEGFFEKEGLKLVFTGEIKSTQLLASILNGNNDLGDGHPNYIAVSIAGGAKIKAVVRSIIEPPADVDPKLRHMRWYINPSSNIKTFAELKNYKPGEKIKINGNKNTCQDFITNTIADNLGISRDRFEWVVMDTDIQAIQAAKQGILDIAISHPPFFGTAEEAKLTQIADSSDSKLGEAAGLYFYYFTEDYINKNPETVKKFVTAVTNAQKWANEHKDETAKLTAEFIGVPVKGNHYYSTTTKIDEKQVEPWLNDLVKNKVIPAGKVKTSDIVTHQFE